MARLTPVNYNMQVLNPLQTAMAGYQAGFGQFQQLDDVRRQREADRMAAELHDAKMAEYERATAAAQAAQQLQADFYSGLADGTMTVSKAREFLGNPNISENIASAVQGFIEDKSEDQIRTQMHDIGRLTMLARNDPEGFNVEMDRRVEAALTVGDQDQLNVLRGLRELSSDPAAGQAVGIQMLAGLAGQLGEEGETYIDAVFKQLDLDKPQSPLTTVGKLNADLAAGRITQDQFNAEMDRLQRADPGTVVTYGPDGTMRVSVGGLAPSSRIGDGLGGEDQFPVEMGAVPPGFERIITTEGPVLRTIRGSDEEVARVGFISESERIKNQLVDFINHPGAEKLYGYDRLNPLNLLPGSDAANAFAKYQTMEGTQFLQGIQNLKAAGNAGAITEIEGLKSASSVSSALNRNQSWESAKEEIMALIGRIDAAQGRMSTGLRPEAFAEYGLTREGIEPYEQTGATRRLRYDETRKTVEQVE
jgi:hypothetical protein